MSSSEDWAWARHPQTLGRLEKARDKAVTAQSDNIIKTVMVAASIADLKGEWGDNHFIGNLSRFIETVEPRVTNLKSERDGLYRLHKAKLEMPASQDSEAGT